MTQNKNKIYFISDAHLGRESISLESQKEQKLLAFLSQIENECETLYVLGDLFDFWFEYKNLIPKQFASTLFALKKLKNSGTKIIYLAGNHDFWLGDFLPQQLEISVHPNHLEVSHQGKKLFLTHGDGLAKKDIGYRVLKKILRNKVNIWLYRQLPADFSFWLAQKVSHSSGNYTQQKNIEYQEYLNFAKGKINSGFDFVIMGHIHQPILEKIDKGYYVNVGDWMKNFSYGVLEEGELRLEKF
ncbi:MAG: Metallophosphoesterase [candidate division Zixibacteria bacterium RBG-1]|nr:MAG: Metallophosphoesterase [candidate division Zixibacteria bacterium RBG-1]OGC83550.1 MAG: hypothetical protein A2V73_05460 [candidate division Zixibacteria bacterium RBG_19FT_COMBO_42_43]